MDRLKKIFGVFIIVLVLAAVGYAIYSVVGGTRKGEIKTVAESSNEGLKLMYGDLGTDITYITDPSQIDYGVSQYPGSKASTQKELSFKGTVNQSQLTVGTFTTGDSVDKVTAYYKTQLGQTAKSGDITSSKYSFNYRFITSEVSNSPVIIVYRSATETVLHLTRPGL